MLLSDIGRQRPSHGISYGCDKGHSLHHHPNVRLLLTEKMLMERVHYIHENPVRAGLMERAEDYGYSSVRCWNQEPWEDEPLLMDIENIKWRSGRRSLRKN